MSPPPTCSTCSLKLAFYRILKFVRCSNKVEDTPSVYQTDLVVSNNNVVSLDTDQYDIKLEEQFKIVDLNKDGYIDGEELRTVMKNLGISTTDEEIDAMLEQADVNGSGKIEEDDFMKVMSVYLSAEKDEICDVRDLFDVFDTDKDGFISAKELKYALSELLQDTSISKKEVETMMRHACRSSGKSKNAMISFRDFQLLLDDVGFSA